MDLMDIIKQQITPEVIGQISQNTGATPQQAAAASEGVTHALVAALNNQAQTPDGAAALHSTLDDHDGSVLDNVMGLFGGAGAGQQQQGGGGIGDILGSVLGGGSGGGLGNVLGSVLGGGGQQQQQQQQQQSGGGIGDILGGLFGGNLGNITTSISHMSGMNTSGVMQLLMQFAPIILGILGQQKAQQNLAPSGLSNILSSAVGDQQGNPIMQMMSHILGGGNTQQGGSGLMDSMMTNVGSHLLGSLFGK
jgi:hypothetical protein